MLRQPTLDLLHELRLAGMAQAFEEQLAMPDIAELAFEDRLSLLLEREKTERAQRRYLRLLHRSKSGEVRMTRNPRPGGPGEPARCPVSYLGRRLAAMGRLPLVTDRHGEE